MRLQATYTLALVAAVATVPVPAQKLLSSTFRADAHLVLVPFHVTDHNGGTVNSLQARDFTIFDDQKEQSIASFSQQDAPCSVGLVLDVSGSMKYALATAKNVAQAFLKTANPEDDFLMLTVSSLPDSALQFTTDTPSLQQAIQSMSPGGMTALNDTVYLALNRMREARHPRRALLILSDGMDNNSRYSKGELMRMALEADVQVYAIVVDGLADSWASGAPFRPAMAQKPWQQAAARQGPMMLEELSQKTGGLHFHIGKESEAVDSATKIGMALRNEYVIGYRAPSTPMTGKWHHVRIKTNLPKVHIYARDGYYSQ